MEDDGDCQMTRKRQKRTDHGGMKESFSKVKGHRGGRHVSFSRAFNGSTSHTFISFKNRPCQNFSQCPAEEETERGCLLNRPSCPPDDPIGQGSELN